MDGISYQGRCRPESVVQGRTYRFSVLTSQLIRLEYQEEGHFEDRPSQLAINRDFETPLFSVNDELDSLEIHTKFLSLYYDKHPFSPGGLYIKVYSPSFGIYSTWRYNDPLTENLGGTARTLDQSDGAVPLEKGLQSRLQGFSVLDDSDSLVFCDSGWVEQREGGGKDLYFFGYGLEFRNCIHDFFRLSGSPPMLPRCALGNWWSRFYPYSDKEYLDLMKRFKDEQIPFSMAVLDMDWHITDVGQERAKGWTGFTWNKKLIGCPEALLDELHKDGQKVILNLHPAEGIQPHEMCYDAAVTAMGRTPGTKETIPFDFCNPRFVRAYFECALSPLERDGVDYWWIDWQQGTDTSISGADPLWLLNHFHFLECEKSGKRPMILSRYAGPGSHRYPIGFSGDSIISWASLRFQPYFTATSANIGYGWWSHDIGGHCGGKRDEELTVRWIQFGVFSPIMRLHSTSNLFNGKEPWKFNEPYCGIIKEYLRLRHRLVPYLYTMNWLSSTDDRFVVSPMYYSYPNCEMAYEVPNQYEFGTQLIVCPITQPADDVTCVGYTTAWLPEQLYYDFFNGLRYRGGRRINLHRPIEGIPVLARAGAIIPITIGSDSVRNDVTLPTEVELRVFCGNSGSFELFEDDGSNDYLSGQHSITRYEFNWEREGFEFDIIPDGNLSGLHVGRRRYKVSFIGIQNVEHILVERDGKPEAFSKTYDCERNTLEVTLATSCSSSTFRISISENVRLARNKIPERIFELLNRMTLDYEMKQRIYNCIMRVEDAKVAFSELMTYNLSQDVLSVIGELLFSE